MTAVDRTDAIILDIVVAIVSVVVLTLLGTVMIILIIYYRRKNNGSAKSETASESSRKKMFVSSDSVTSDSFSQRSVFQAPKLSNSDETGGQLSFISGFSKPNDKDLDSAASNIYKSFTRAKFQPVPEENVQPVVIREVSDPAIDGSQKLEIVQTQQKARPESTPLERTNEFVEFSTLEEPSEFITDMCSTPFDLNSKQIEDEEAFWREEESTTESNNVPVNQGHDGSDPNKANCTIVTEIIEPTESIHDNDDDDEEEGIDSEMEAWDDKRANSMTEIQFAGEVMPNGLLRPMVVVESPHPSDDEKHCFKDSNEINDEIEL